MTDERYRSCIESCDVCAEICESCAAACLAEHDVAQLVRCIRLDVDCAALCRLASSFMARGSENVPAVLAACADVCKQCGEECARHKMEHCQLCAEACRRCAEECQRMAGRLGAGFAVAA